MLEDELHFQLLRRFHFSNRAIVAQTSQLKLMPGQPKILEKPVAVKPASGTSDLSDAVEAASSGSLVAQ